MLAGKALSYGDGGVGDQGVRMPDAYIIWPAFDSQLGQVFF